MENPFKGVNHGGNQENKMENNDKLDEVKNNIADDLDKAVEEKVEAYENDAAQSENVAEEVNPWQEKYETLNNQYIRLAADFDNFRKRQEQERENLLKYGAENTVKKLIEVIDNFERGAKAIEKIEDCEKVKECFNLAYKNLTDVLGKIGLEVIPAEGEEFDPNLHEAVMQTPTDEKPEHTIIAELQKGYKLGDKVLRPTLVNVATAP